MKRNEIEKCALCIEGMMHDQSIYFYRVKVEQLVLDMNVIQQNHGLEVMLGSVELASVMGTDPDIATALGESKTILVCASCSHSNAISYLAELCTVETEDESKV